MSDAPKSTTGTLDPAQSVEGLLQLARARAQAGDSAGAGRTFAAALHLAETHDLWEPTARAQAWLAGVDVRAGRLGLARERLDHAWSLCIEHGLPADVQADVSAQLGQVLVFQGKVGAGVALMRIAIERLTQLQRTTARDELELALAAISSRARQAVADAEPASAAHVQSLARVAEVQLGMGEPNAARATYAAIWLLRFTPAIPPATRVRLGLDYAQLLAASGPDHHLTAWAILTEVEPELSSLDGAAHEFAALQQKLMGQARPSPDAPEH